MGAWPQIASFVGILLSGMGVFLSHRSLKQRHREWEESRMKAENERMVKMVKAEAERDGKIEDIGEGIEKLRQAHEKQGALLGKICEAFASLTGKTINGIDYRP